MAADLAGNFFSCTHWGSSRAVGAECGRHKCTYVSLNMSMQQLRVQHGVTCAMVVAKPITGKLSTDNHNCHCNRRSNRRQQRTCKPGLGMHKWGKVANECNLQRQVFEQEEILKYVLWKTCTIEWMTLDNHDRINNYLNAVMMICKIK